MLYEKLNERARQNRVSFAMPGHKGGKWIAEPLHRVMEIDMTELPGTDNMHHPEGILRDSLTYIAQAYGAAHSYFSVNGSTGGILSALHFAASRGAAVIADRNCHASAIHALCLSGLSPFYLPMHFVSDFGVPDAVRAEDVKRALAAHPEAACVFVTSPNYFGICADIAAIADAVHAAGKLLIVDEAHGAHFGFSPLLPRGAVREGADIVIQSAHKTLPAPNQTAMIHLSARVEEAEFSKWYSLFQTTSPSYPLMALTDYAVHTVAERGTEIYETLYAQIRRMDVPFPRLSGDTAHGDFTRLVYCTAAGGTRGYDAAAHLEKCGIDVEMADCNNVVCIATGGNTARDFAVLEKALRSCPRASSAVQLLVPPPVKQGVLPRAAFWAPSVYVPLAEAEGRIAAETVAAFPPCVPILAPGEIVTREQIDYLRAVRRMGGTVTGLKEEKIRVAAEME